MKNKSKDLELSVRHDPLDFDNLEIMGSSAGNPGIYA